jgi:hypothetical protein
MTEQKLPLGVLQAQGNEGGRKRGEVKSALSVKGANEDGPTPKSSACLPI